MAKDKFELRPTRNNVHKLIENMAELFKIQAKLKNNKLKVEMS
jgi:hypothetical protein